ncbi:ankyrin repeat, PH and SEC7 domain containing protein secG-like [Ptychodera flava]|uniref:ankyrin repeat, PH and SEC7 domain containing protein secG-like n=1 Tax=Ptychodera flava TaxID=63121 RepID=UPI00396A09B0
MAADGNTYLHIAAGSGDIDKVNAAIKAGADVNDGFSPLHVTAYKGHKDVAEILIGAKANGRSSYKAPVYSFNHCSNRRPSRSGYDLIDAGTNKEARCERQCTPLICAAQEGHADVVRILIDVGANKEACDKHLFTPLMLGSTPERDRDVVKIMIGSRANKEARSQNQYTPLIWAATKGHQEVVRILMMQVQTQRHVAR